MPDREHTLYLLDGMALVYRAHFAFVTNPIRTSAGRNTSAIYGFTNTLLELLTKQAPTHLAVVFDTGAPTARHAAFPAYKAQRQEMPEELSAAIPDVKRLIRAFNLPALELDGYEADDIIGTFAREACAAGFSTYMVTPDKDFGQLVNDCVHIYRPGRMGDGAEILRVPEVLAKWGIVRCDQVRDILGFAGDTSDNIPGIPGIGEKTAQKLIAQYDTLENTLDHFAEQKGKLRESLEKFREQALLSKRLVTIDVNVPLPFEPDVLRVGPRDEPALRALFAEFEFNTIGRRLFGDSFKAGRGGAVSSPGGSASGLTQTGSRVPPVAVAGPATESPGGSASGLTLTSSVSKVADVPSGDPSSGGPDNLLSGRAERAGGHQETSTKTIRHPEPVEGSAPIALPQTPPIPPIPVALRTIDDAKPDYQIITDRHEFAKRAEPFQGAKSIAVAYDIDSAGSVKGQAICIEPGLAVYIAFGPPFFLNTGFVGRSTLIGHDLKPALRAMGIGRGRADAASKYPALFDTALAHSVVFPDLRHTLEFVSESLLNYTPIPSEKPSGQQDFLAEMESPDAAQLSARRTMERADLALQLHAKLVPLLEQSGQQRVFAEIESPLMPVLAAMENEGIRLDPAALEDVGKKLRADLARLETSIYAHAGGPFNIGSPKQLGELLFGKLALDQNAKKTKTGQFSTDEATLTALAPMHPIVAEVMEHRVSRRSCSAPTSTRCRNPSRPSPAASTPPSTSSPPPPAASIRRTPIFRTSPSAARRAAKSAAPSSRATATTPSSPPITRRSSCASSPRSRRIPACSRRSPAARTSTAPPPPASSACPSAEVTKEQRNQAKMVNYGISYGISAFGLAQRLGIGRADAKALIDGYFAQYPGIKKYMTDTVAQARERGYVETVTGRRRYLPDIRSANATVRSAAERNANQHAHPGLQRRPDQDRHGPHRARAAREENWRTKLLLQVHDELVFDLYLPEKEHVLEIVQDRMRNALPELRVPIVVETGLGANWLEAH